MSYMRLSQGQLIATNEFGGSFTLGSGQMAAQRFIPRPGKAVSGVIIRQNAAASGCNFDVLLCNDNAGAPDTANPLRAVSAIVANASGSAIHEVDFPTPVALTYPNRYWIVVRNNTSVNFVTFVWRNSSSLHEGVSHGVRQFTTAWQTQTNNRWGCLIKYSDDTYQGECVDTAGSGLTVYHTSASDYREFGMEIVCPNTHGYNITALVATTTAFGTQPNIRPKIYINQQLVHEGPELLAAAISNNSNTRFDFETTISIPPDSKCQVLLAAPNNIGANGIRVYGADVRTFNRPGIIAHFGLNHYRPCDRTQSGFGVYTSRTQYFDTILDCNRPFVFPGVNRRQFNSMR